MVVDKCTLKIFYTQGKTYIVKCKKYKSIPRERRKEIAKFIEDNIELDIYQLQGRIAKKFSIPVTLTYEEGSNVFTINEESA